MSGQGKAERRPAGAAPFTLPLGTPLVSTCCVPAPENTAGAQQTGLSSPRGRGREDR